MVDIVSQYYHEGGGKGEAFCVSTVSFVKRSHHMANAAEFSALLHYQVISYRLKFGIVMETFLYISWLKVLIYLIK